MKNIGSSRASPRRARYFWLAAVGPVVAGVIAMVVAIQPAIAAVAPVGLGTAGSFAVLAGTTVTNTGVSNIGGNLGVSPGTAVTGFPPGLVTPPGAVYTAAGAAGAQADLTTAYNDAAGRPPTVNVTAFIGAGQSLDPGVYKASSSMEVGGSLTLNAHGKTNAVFIFQAPSTLITDTGTTITLTNGAQACNVFWQVGSSATLQTGTTFAGTILALTSITVTNSVTIIGRALARNGAVTLDTDTITVPSCTTTPPPTPTPTPTTTTPPPSPTPTPTTTTPPPSPTPTPTTTTPPPSPTPTPTMTRPPPSPTPTPTMTRPPPSPTPTPTMTRPTPTPTPTMTRPPPSPTPTPTMTRPTSPPTSPPSTFTHPAPSPTSPTSTATSPKPKPKPKPKTKPKPKPKTAPAPKPVGATFPVTG